MRRVLILAAALAFSFAASAQAAHPHRYGHFRHYGGYPSTNYGGGSKLSASAGALTTKAKSTATKVVAAKIDFSPN